MIGVAVEAEHTTRVTNELKHLSVHAPISGVPTEEGYDRVGFSQVYDAQSFIEKARALPGVRHVEQY
jgi:hypothetical protein